MAVELVAGARDALVARPLFGGYGRRPALAGLSSVVGRVDDLKRIYPLQIDRGDPEVGMPELPLDGRQPDPFGRHVDRVRGPPE
jgi:hypothetical protein